MNNPEDGPENTKLTGYGADAFHDVDKKSECDLIMKGGITSGVVYPYAITEIAKKYHFRAIGGTSAGAIAAAFAAAAEYARSWTDPEKPEKNSAATGFHRLNKKSLELPKILLT
ncbi:RpoH suppressor, partial [hydrothermal vent metagenome]